MANNPQPLVSIISFCKDRAQTIRRSVDSVVSQSYRHLEFVVQDGASTDGTLEILRGYNDPRIKLISEPDSGPAEAFWKVMNRCEGDIIGTCLSDEELLPGAIEKAVEFFRDNPDVGAMTCDGWVTDMDGKIINEFNAGEFNFIDYLFGKYCPLWSGTFFRRQALLDVGLKHHDWTIECLEFETWCRLATRHVVKHVPVRMSKYAVHTTQLSNTKQYFHEHFDNRAKVIRKLFSKGGFFGDDEVKLNGCLYNQMYLLYNHVRAYRLRDQEDLIFERIKEFTKEIPAWNYIRYKEYFNFLDNPLTKKFGIKEAVVDDSAIFRRISNIWLRGSLALPSSVRRRLPTRFKDGLRHSFTTMLYIFIAGKGMLRWGIRHWREVIKNATTDFSLVVAPKHSPRLYHDIASIYYARGQIEETLENLRRAESLGDRVIDGLACQSMLMSSRATYQGLLEIQRRWAAKHAVPDPKIGQIRQRIKRDGRKLRVGIYSAFMESYVIKAMVLSVLKHIDRERFELYGYSLSPSPSNVEELFDHFVTMGATSDQQFVETVRSDGLDIFIETTGFSPQNCFAAMASRCAPIQISYVNHTGTSAVQNVDYVFADEISVPEENDKWFTERVWRLPGCFFCFNYDGLDMPSVAEVSSKKYGPVVFGCFGSGGKIGLELIKLWAKILRQASGAKLFIRNRQLTSPVNRQFLIDRFGRFGIGPDRLLLMEGADRETILKCYDDVDISLDTWPYCGGNTIAESLWQGVPVVTLKGDRFSARYGASLVTAGGCPELVAETPEDYVRIAVDLSRRPDRLAHYRRNLRKMTEESGLSDAAGFARKLEDVFTEMVAELDRQTDSAGNAAKPGVSSAALVTENVR